jgi:hypothetical protein
MSVATSDYFINGSLLPIYVMRLDAGWCIADSHDSLQAWWLSARGWGNYQESVNQCIPSTLFFSTEREAGRFVQTYSGWYPLVEERVVRLMRNFVETNSSSPPQYAHEWLLAHPDHVGFLESLDRIIRDWGSGVDGQQGKLRFYLARKVGRPTLCVVWRAFAPGFKTLDQLVSNFGTGATAKLVV